jgi:hypothetical protein
LVVNIVNEDVVVNIESIKERAVNIEEPNPIVITPFDISSTFEQKINDEPIFDAIS